MQKSPVAGADRTRASAPGGPRRRAAEAGMRRTAPGVKHHVVFSLATGSVVLWTRNSKRHPRVLHQPLRACLARCGS